MTAPSKELLDAYRRQRLNAPAFVGLYPYTMGRIEECLTTSALTPKAKVAMALLQIKALDIVNAEPFPERKEVECPTEPSQA